MGLVLLMEVLKARLLIRPEETGFRSLIDAAIAAAALPVVDGPATGAEAKTSGLKKIQIQ